MPHAGLMSDRELGPEAGPFQRARLHLRGGRRRLRQGKVAAGVVTLADALSAALEWYIASPERRSMIDAGPDDDLRDDATAYKVLVRVGVLDGKFDYEAFDRLTDYALQHELPGFDHGPVLAGIERVMIQLGILPFDEADLPSENPDTF